MCPRLVGVASKRTPRLPSLLAAQSTLVGQGGVEAVAVEGAWRNGGRLFAFGKNKGLLQGPSMLAQKSIRAGLVPPLYFFFFFPFPISFEIVFVAK